LIKIFVNTKGEFGIKLKSHLILLFNLFLLLFTGLIAPFGTTAPFGTIHESHYIILTNFYLYIKYFQQKVFSFSKISGFQTDHYCR